MQASLTFSSHSSRQVDGALVQVRWILAIIAWAVIAAGAGSPLPNELVLAWLTLLIVFNLLLFVLVRSKDLSPSLPKWGLVGDIVLFGLLPYTVTGNSSILFLFALYPTVVAALRYGAAAGTIIAVALALPYELRALAALLPEPLRGVLIGGASGDITFATAGLPVLALFAVVLLVGYLAQREREAAAGVTAVELEQLRREMEGAKLLYDMTDTLSQTLSYSKVLEAMLEAGVKGMPKARQEDGSAVGVVFLFESGDPERTLHVVAWRNLDRTDTNSRIQGKEGIVTQALDSGEPVVFADVASDPELSALSSLRRCRAGVCFPLQAGLSQYGAVVLATPAPRVPDEQHLSLMRAFTNQAAVGFQNAHLYESLRHERDRIIDAEAAARARLARDLHDGPTQSVAALVMRMDYINTLWEREPEKAKAELALARQSAIKTGRELRELLFTLRPLTLETQGLSGTLKLWGQRLRETENVPLDLDPGNIGPEVDLKLAGTVFSIMEEAVANARKHGDGALIHVTVCRQGGNLVASVRDEGPGFDVATTEKSYDQRGSLGLVNMRERAKLVDGNLLIDSAPGRGTQVTLIAPIGGRAP